MSKIAVARPITAEIRALQVLPTEGDMIRPGWSRHIRSNHEQAYELAGETSRRKVSRARPFAMILLARTVFMYSPSPDRDENGRVIGWVRKFHGPFWFPNWQELADEFGCTIRTLRDEAALLESLGLIRFEQMRERAEKDGARAVPEYLIPVPKAIIKITDRPVVGAGEETSSEADEETSVEPMKKLPRAGEETSAEPVKKLHRTSSPSTSLPTTSSPEEGKRAPARPAWELIEAIAVACDMNPKIKSVAGRCGRVAKDLMAVEATPDQVKVFAAWARLNWWRCQKSNQLYPEDLPPNWQQAMKTGAKPSTPPTGNRPGRASDAEAEQFRNAMRAAAMGGPQ